MRLETRWYRQDVRLYGLCEPSRASGNRSAKPLRRAGRPGDTERPVCRDKLTQSDHAQPSDDLRLISERNALWQEVYCDGLDNSERKYLAAIQRAQASSIALSAAAKNRHTHCCVTIGPRAQVDRLETRARALRYAQLFWQHQATRTSSDAIAAIRLSNAPAQGELEAAVVTLMSALVRLSTLQRIGKVSRITRIE